MLADAPAFEKMGREQLAKVYAYEATRYTDAATIEGAFGCLLKGFVTGADGKRRTVSFIGLARIVRLSKLSTSTSVSVRRLLVNHFPSLNAPYTMHRVRKAAKANARRSAANAAAALA